MLCYKFIVALFSASFLGSCFVYQHAISSYNRKIYERREDLGGQYAEHLYSCQKLDKILNNLKHLVDDPSKAELEAIFCYLKYGVKVETSIDNQYLEKQILDISKNHHDSVLPILKKNIKTLNSEKRIFKLPLCQTFDDLSNLIPFLKKNLNGYNIEIRRDINKTGMVYCIPTDRTS